MFKRHHAPTFFAAFIAAASASAEPPRFEITRITLPPGFDSGLASAINDRGEVMGSCTVSDPRTTSPFYWHNGSMKVLPRDLNLTYAVAINNRQQAAGTASPGGSFNEVPLFWDRSTNALVLPDLQGLGGYTKDINDAGTIAGTCFVRDPSFYLRAVVWEDGKIIPLPGIGGDEWNADGINESGQVAGSAYDDQYNLRAVRWTNNEVDLVLTGFDGIHGADAYDINDFGEMVGYSHTGGFQLRAVAWSANGTVRDFGEEYDYAYNINNNGVIILSGLYTSSIFVVYDNKPFDIHDYTIGLRPGEKIRLLELNNADMFAAVIYDPETNLGSPALLTPVHLDLSSPQPGHAGTVNAMEVTGVTPGAEVVFAYSLEDGYHTIPGKTCGGKGFGMHEPRIIANAVADADGRAVFKHYVSPTLRGKTVYLQVVERDTCKLSNRVKAVFE